MERIKLQSDIRNERGSRSSRSMRADGRVPCVVYGKDRKALALSLDEKEIRKVIGKNSLIDLIYEGGQASVVLKDFQRHPVKGNPIHVDFLEVDLDTKITITVPVQLEGTPKGVGSGGILQQTLREIELECLPTEMPDYLTVDISHLKIGEYLMVSEIKVPGNTAILTSPDETVATVVTPTVSVEEDGTDDEEVEIATDAETAEETA